MDQDQTNGTSITESTPGLSRRKVVRAAATAAWATPVIVAATSAPAFAASGNTTPAAVATVIGLVTRVNNDVKVPITFTNGGGPTTGLVVDVVITTVAGGINARQPTVTSTGWVRSSEAKVLLTTQMNVQFAKASPQIGGNVGVDNTSVLEFTFNGFFANGFLNGNITVTPTVQGAPGSTAAPASQAFEVSAAVPRPPQ